MMAAIEKEPLDDGSNRKKTLNDGNKFKIVFRDYPRVSLRLIIV